MPSHVIAAVEVVTWRLGMKPADALSEDERAFCVENFFHGPSAGGRSHPCPRYAELLARPWEQQARVERRAQALNSRPMTSGTFRSGQAGVDRRLELRAGRAHRALVAKGRGYTEGQGPAARGGAETASGRAGVPVRRPDVDRSELSTSHVLSPILPLLCDTASTAYTPQSSRCRVSAFAGPRRSFEQLTRAVRVARAAIVAGGLKDCGHPRARCRTRGFHSSRAQGFGVDGDRRSDLGRSIGTRVYARRRRERRAARGSVSPVSVGALRSERRLRIQRSHDLGF